MNDRLGCSRGTIASVTFDGTIISVSFNGTTTSVVVTNLLHFMYLELMQHFTKQIKVLIETG
jgi:hypothetical protein